MLMFGTTYPTYSNKILSSNRKYIQGVVYYRELFWQRKLKEPIGKLRQLQLLLLKTFYIHYPVL